MTSARVHVLHAQAPHFAAEEDIMGKLRQKMTNDMIVRGLSKQTRDLYLRAVVGLVRYYLQSPDLLTADQVRAYLVYLHSDRKLSWSSCSVAAHGLRFFLPHDLGAERYRVRGSGTASTISAPADPQCG